MAPLESRKRKRASGASVFASENDTIEVRPRRTIASKGPSERPPLRELRSRGNAAKSTSIATPVEVPTTPTRLPLAQVLPEASERIIPPDCCYHCRTRGGNAAYECFKEDGEALCTRCIRDKKTKCRLPTSVEAVAIAARCPYCTRRGFTRCNGADPCDTCIRNKTSDKCQRPPKKVKREQPSTPSLHTGASKENTPIPIATGPEPGRSERAQRSGNAEQTSADGTCTISPTLRRSARKRKNLNQGSAHAAKGVQLLEDDLQQLLHHEAVANVSSRATSPVLPTDLDEARSNEPAAEDEFDQHSVLEHPAVGGASTADRADEEDHGDITFGADTLATPPASRDPRCDADEDVLLNNEIINDLEQDVEMEETNNPLCHNITPPSDSNGRPRRSLGKISYKDRFPDALSDHDSAEEEGSENDNDSDSDIYVAPGVDAESEDDDMEDFPLGESDTSDQSDTDTFGELFDENELIDDVEGPARSKKPHKRKACTSSSQQKQGKGIDLSLPPLYNIKDCFADMTSNGVREGLSNALERLKGAPIKVATMCSGTESPLLALSEISKALEDTGFNAINFEHEFSAEIEVFKQAYIERNFQPNILFRDVRDFLLPDAQTATTAYGAEVEIPAQIDILIAGFVCKDLSRLNNKGRSLDSGGESGDTWLAVYTYADRFRPGVVLLENVKATKKTWESIVSQWDEIDYEAAWLWRDTKNYYLPQTRERMYMIAIDRRQHGKGTKEAAKQWQDVMESLERQCSSPYEAFLAESLQEPSDYSTLLSEPDWALCKLRYDHIRSERRLGILRPITRWSENGTVRPPDCANRKWYESQSSRVYDAIDVAHLQGAQEGHDTLYKMAVWDVSQNVDRFKADLGILPCITPGGSDFSSNRQQALNGSQLLLLQGMPLDRLLFANETQRERQDLAGNAMSTTVIGASLISAIISSWKSFDSPPSSRFRSTGRFQAKPDHAFSRSDVLKPTATKPAKSEQVDMDRLRQQAIISARMCVCEGSKRICASTIQICSACEHTACAKCAGNPRHVYDEIVQKRFRAQAPDEFIRQWRPRLPARLRFSTFPDMSGLGSGLDASSQSMQQFLQIVGEAQRELRHFCIGDFSRHNRHWKVTYGSSRATLELIIGRQVQWLLFVKCPANVAGDDPLRTLLKCPVARGNVQDTLLKPQWEIHTPSDRQFDLQISGSAERSRSWRNRLGLPEYSAETVPTTMSVKSHAEELSVLSGEYEYLPHCGTASNSLYKKVAGRAVYMFLDPNPIGPMKHDSIVFTHDCSRKHYGEHRLTLARVESSWRPWHIKDDRVYNVKTSILGSWSPAVLEMDMACVSMDVGVLSEDVLTPDLLLDCSHAVPFLDVLLQEELPVQAFHDYSWALEHIKLLPSFPAWQTIKPKPTANCSCAPKHPNLNWSIDKKGVALAHEDGRAAAEFERAIKTRAPIFKLEANSDLSRTHIRIGINLSSLIHRAQGRLVSSRAVNTSWRLVVDHASLPSQPFAKFHLQSNLSDALGTVPASVKYLRGTQPKSLAWMTNQERGKEIVVTEVEEEIHPDLGWRVEARAQTTCTVRGGVLADHPSFGKTVTTIALIQSEFERYSPEDLVKQNRSSEPDHPFFLDSGATLIVSPPHIVLQWKSELEKFLDVEQYELYNVRVIATYAQLKCLTIADVQESRVLIASWAIFSDEEYISDLARFTAMPEPATKVMSSRRAFDAWLNRVVEDIPDRLRDLSKHGPLKFQQLTNDLFEQRLDHPDFNAALPLKIRHGSAYQSWSTMRVASVKSNPSTAKTKNARAGASIHPVPLPHLFRFNRVVVDEYHYLNDVKKMNSSLAAIAIKKLAAPKRWVLSGTPALSNFSDVNDIASFLGLQLGRYYFGDGTTTTATEKIRRGDQTHVEDFLSQTEIPSRQWHEARHERAQEFLDIFVRQNEAQLQHISCSEKLVPVVLDAAHHAVYLELSQHLISQRMQIKKVNKKLGSDRTDRLNDSLDQSASAEEALLKSALLFETEDGVSGLELIMKKRSHQRRSTEKELRGLLAGFEGLMIMERMKPDDGDADEASIEELYGHFRNDMAHYNWLGDNDSTQRVRALLTEASKQPTKNTFPELRGQDNRKRSKLLKIRLSQMRELAGELTLRIRSERFIGSIKAVLQPSAGSTAVFTCNSPHCNGTVSLAELHLVTHCGHTACQTCLDDRIDPEVCVHPQCNAPVYNMNLIRLSDVGSVRDQCAGRSFGKKIDAIIQIIQALPQDDQAIVSAPNDEIISILERVFQEYEITYHSPSRCRPAASAGLIEDFKNNKKPRERKQILILNLGSESAAGVNLVNANHVIFVSPLLAKTQYEYDSAMVQAIARCRRYGQTQKVHIYHIVALHTIDVDILEHRHRRVDGMTTWTLPMRMPKITATKKEKTRLIRNRPGRMALVPTSWLTDEAKRKVLNVEEPLSSFTSLINFSETFEHDDE